MKKTFYALFAVLLVLALATCDNGPGDEVVTEEGMVKLTIKVADLGAGRAVNLTNAKTGLGAANHYEAVFRHGPTGTPKYYQVDWDSATGEGEIDVPAGNYTGVATAGVLNDAVLFAGFYNGTDYTLLGVGTISSTTGGSNPGPNQDIRPGTDGVVFTVTALENGVSNNKNSSTFKITGPTASVVHNDWDYATETTANDPAAIPTVGSFPVFPVPGYEGSAAYANPGTPGPGTIKATYEVTIPVPGKVIMETVGSATDTTTTITNMPVNGTTIVLANNSVSCALDIAADDAIAAGSPLNATTVFTFIINVNSITSNGLRAISIDARVRALTNTSTAYEVGTPIPWHIRGGTSATTVDNGTTGNGAAVILAVGTNFNVTEAHLTIPNPVWPNI